MNYLNEFGKSLKNHLTEKYSISIRHLFHFDVTKFIDLFQDEIEQVLGRAIQQLPVGSYRKLSDIESDEFRQSDPTGNL
jgi:hypothetical protein